MHSRHTHNSPKLENSPSIKKTEKIKQWLIHTTELLLRNKNVWATYTLPQHGWISVILCWTKDTQNIYWFHLWLPTTRETNLVKEVKTTVSGKGKNTEMLDQGHKYPPGTITFFPILFWEVIICEYTINKTHRTEHLKFGHLSHVNYNSKNNYKASGQIH